MKKFFLVLIFSLLAFNCYAEDVVYVDLPAPNKEGGLPFMEVLSKRQSYKKFTGQEFDKQTISNVLWAAFGINREDGRRTIPTARNMQNLHLYAVLPDGVYSYDAKGNRLELLASGDHRANIGDQSEMLSKAAMIIVYVEKLGDTYNKFNTGAAAQNVGLYAASSGLANVVVASIKTKKVMKLINPSKGMQIQVIQAVGYKG